MTRRRVSRAVLVTLIAAAAGVGYLRCHGRARAPEDPGTASSTGRERLLGLRHQAPGAMSGRVTAAGAPIAATVCARRGDEATREVPRCIASNDRGEYVIDDLQPGGYVVWASAARYAGGSWRGVDPASGDSLWIGAGERKTGVDLTLTGGAVEVHGIVRDVRGRPIAAAMIHVGNDARTSPRFTTRSARDGTFLAWSLPGEIDVAASAEGYVDNEASAIAPIDQLEIVLTPESTLSGIVVEAGSRRPLADVTVAATDRRTRTDAAGRFVLPKLAPGRYKPTATGIGGYGESAESVLLGLGQSIGELVIELHPVAVVEGRLVIDDGSGRACPPDQGEVSLGRYGSPAFYRARTIDDGLVLLEGVVPGDYEVTAHCEHWVSAVPYPDLAVGDSDVGGVIWKVMPGARIAGRVSSRDGAPIAGAVINHAAVAGTGSGYVMSAADGSFVADGITPGATEVSARAEGFVSTDAKISVVAAIGTVARAELVLDKGGSIEGMLVDDTGKPVAGTWISAQGPSSESSSTDVRGAFRIDALAPGRYEVSSERGWSQPPRAADAVHTVVANVTVGQVARVRLVAESWSGVIAGTVVDASGSPITDAYVEAAREETSDDGRTSRTSWYGTVALTDLAGRFRIAEVPPGRFTIRAYREGGGEVILEHVAPGDRPRLTIRPTGVLAGIVVAADARPVDDVMVRADDPVHELVREERLFRAGGRFTLRDLPAGIYRVTVGGEPRSVVTVPLAEGERRDDLRLTVLPRFTIRGRLVAAGGRSPLQGWKVEAPRRWSDENKPDGGHVTTWGTEIALTGPDGRFLLRNMVAGTVTIEAACSAMCDARAGEPAPSPIRTLTLGSTPDVDLGDIAVPASVSGP